MLIPERVAEQRKRRHWYCDTCRKDLGMAKRWKISGEMVFTPSVFLLAATRLGDRSWRLMCVDGHSTAWNGSGIVWFEHDVKVSQEAA